MLSPRRVKHRKQMRGRMTGRAMRGNKVSNGEYGLQALEPHWITANQIEAARVAMTRYTKRGGQVWIKLFPDKSVSKKPAETRMGSGKGAPEYWVAVVKPGRVMFEIAGVSEEVAREAMRLGANKLPVKCKFVKREDEAAAPVKVKPAKAATKPEKAKAAEKNDVAEPAKEAPAPAAPEKEAASE